MRRLFSIIAILGIVLPSLSSCRAISNILRNGEVVAQAGKERLYRSDIDQVVPKGISEQDSILLARQYIDAWASDRIYVAIAEQQLPKAEKDVTKELEAYRTSLLKYRYEQLYVNERLDTAVSDDKVEEYYLAHKENFRLERPLVKARFLRIHTDSPMLETIRKKMDSSDANDLVEADSLAFSSAMMFTTWQDEWQDVIILAREMGMTYDSMLGQVRNGWVRQDDTTGVTNLAFVSELIKAGDYAPMEYTSERIKDIIISTRKQALISSLEQDLLNDARENGKLVIY
ncbi:MAG: hypothetical protein IJ023_08260 [Bacteroidales bacterium]|nr:hypothetical protein [Bacteroidales bacterium]